MESTRGETQSNGNHDGALLLFPLHFRNWRISEQFLAFRDERLALVQQISFRRDGKAVLGLRHGELLRGPQVASCAKAQAGRQESLDFEQRQGEEKLLRGQPVERSGAPIVLLFLSPLIQLLLFVFCR